MRCPHCEGEFVFVPGWKYCSFCGRTLFSDDLEEGVPLPPVRVTSQEVSASSPPDTDASMCAWEDPRAQGFLRPLFITIRDSCVSSTRFFSARSVAGTFGPPILYAVIIQMTAATGRLAWAALLGKGSAALMMAPGASMTAAGAALMPLFIVMGLVAWALLIHGALIVLNGRKRGLEGTLRVVCYSTTPDLMGVIPIVGEIVGLVWKTYLTLSGLKAVHRVGMLKAAAAITLPIMVTTVLVLVAALVLVLGALS